MGLFPIQSLFRLRRLCHFWISKELEDGLITPLRVTCQIWTCYTNNPTHTTRYAIVHSYMYYPIYQKSASFCTQRTFFKEIKKGVNENCTLSQSPWMSRTDAQHNLECPWSIQSSVYTYTWLRLELDRVKGSVIVLEFPDWGWTYGHLLIEILFQNLNPIYIKNNCSYSFTVVCFQKLWFVVPSITARQSIIVNIKRHHVVKCNKLREAATHTYRIRDNKVRLDAFELKTQSGNTNLLSY